MKHYLITRFNLRTNVWEVDKSGQKVLDGKWLEHRFELFREYCFPSVKSQKNQNFVWFLGFDSTTPDQWKQRFSDLLSPMKNVITVYCDDIKQFIPRVKALIKDDLTSTDEYMITTRLDNDDMISEDFIGTIQKLANSANRKNRLVIDLRRGLQLYLGAEATVRSFTWKYNAFISLVEHVGVFVTVHDRMHQEWEGEGNIIVFKKRPMWIQLVHDRNMVNSQKRLLYFAFKPELSKCQINEAVQTNSLLRTFVRNCRVFINNMFS